MYFLTAKNNKLKAYIFIKEYSWNTIFFSLSTKTESHLLFSTFGAVVNKIKELKADMGDLDQTVATISS
jgi:hypothetical protein